MRIVEIRRKPNCALSVVAQDGTVGEFDVSPYLEYEAFKDPRDPNAFQKVSNGGYFIEWDCGTDLSADAIEARRRIAAAAACRAKQYRSGNRRAMREAFSFPDSGQRTRRRVISGGRCLIRKAAIQVMRGSIGSIPLKRMTPD